MNRRPAPRTRARLLPALALLLAFPACASDGLNQPAAAEDGGSELVSARVLQYRGDHDRAFAAYLAMAESRPDFLPAFEGAAVNATSPEQRKRLRALLERESGRLPDFHGTPYRTLLAILEEDLVERERLLAGLERDAGPKAGWPLSALGDIHFERGNVRTAIDSYESALRVTPDLARAHLGLARARMKQGDHLGAATAYENYLRGRPRDPEALYNVGWILLTRREQPRSAKPWLERAQRVLPDDVAILMALGTTEMMLGNDDEAEGRFLEALKIAPEDPDVHWNLALLYADHLGRPRDALAHFRACLEHGGTPKQRIEEAIRQTAEKAGVAP